eukprot:TRINITY_DN8148_c0_g2_i2.p1 TRINITY_DN8148_c0_g2~~TRINITY_DN8148_c0_g2_i2.p1  ORF type:complete len:298 (+),score=116.87 TRINITY_DN8148_c0_g2_i2:79-972(+)
MSRQTSLPTVANKEKALTFFRKFNASREGRTDEPQPSTHSLQRQDSGSGRNKQGAAQLATQNQQDINVNDMAVGASRHDGGRNFSPVIAANYEPLLPDPFPRHSGRTCLVLDLDETLVHSSFKPVPKPDIILPIEIDGTIYQVYVKKRPFVEEFIKFCEPLFEVVVFTASLSKYADPLLDHLDPGKRFLGPHRLFREHCSHTSGAYVKDLSLLGRPLNKICIIDNSPVAYLFQRHNALPCTSWFEDGKDTELRDFQPLLQKLAESDNVYTQLDEYHKQMAKKGRTVKEAVAAVCAKT